MHTVLESKIVYEVGIPFFVKTLLQDIILCQNLAYFPHNCVYSKVKKLYILLIRKELA